MRSEGTTPSTRWPTVAVTRLLNAKEAGEMLNVPISWVLAQARADRIPHVRLGRYVRFDSNELQARCRSCASGPWRSPTEPPS